ncbi:MAG TPA: sorbosone dehydrogenase family protein [Burkholderiaceae bacterium]|nr:sorbosone dehydrogenase family protein [Burkholderiaceae bacterium]
MPPYACLTLLCVLTLGGCASENPLPLSATTGPNPTLPPPSDRLIPRVNVAPVHGWPAGAKPQAAQGMQVTAFATGLDHPRWVYVLPNGDVLVAETAPPPRPQARKGIKGRVMGFFLKRAGSAVPSANRITLLRDADGDGVAEVRATFLENLNSPFGMWLHGGELYVANTDAVLRFPYRAGETTLEAPGVKVADLPAGPRNHHWTKNIIVSPDGSKLYATVGSNSNVAEHGIEEEAGRAAIWEIDLKNGQRRIFASGLRNPNGLAWEPKTGALWTVVNERDELGDNLVPDYLTTVKDGGFYGWPYSYFGAHLDPRVEPQRPDLVARAIKPDYALGNHVAPLGLTFAQGSRLPPPFTEGAFIGQHGSWNRTPRSGYNVVFVPFKNGRPAADDPIEVLSGFVNDKGQALGRPVGVAIDKRGGLLVADDVGNAVWRVAGAAQSTVNEAAGAATKSKTATSETTKSESATSHMATKAAAPR